jgi:hypothetical protein
MLQCHISKFKWSCNELLKCKLCLS